MLQNIELVLPVDGINLLVSHLAQIALYIDGNPAAAGEKLHHLWREIIAQQTAQVINLGLHLLQLLDGKWISLGKHALLALVLVFLVDVLEEHRVAGWIEGDINASLAHLLYRFGLCRVHCRDERETHVFGQLIDGVCEVKRGAACHIHSTVGSNNLILGYMSYTTNIFHHFYFKTGAKLQKNFEYFLGFFLYFYFWRKYNEEKDLFLLWYSYFNVPLHPIFIYEHYIEIKNRLE